jgi:pyridoxamine 5'-phosphate oxidase-like protein
MTIPDDVAAFLGRHTRMFLLTRRRDGAPTIHPMTGFFADGRVTMTTYRKSAKARNVARDERASCLVVNGYGREDVQGALVRGRGRLREGAMVAPGASASAVPKVSDSVTARVADRMASGKRVLLDVEPDEARFVDRFWSE